ncbi:MAG TPA: hypothetical protein VGH71_07905 [Gammaproteobacteria bacterium]
MRTTKLLILSLLLVASLGAAAEPPAPLLQAQAPIQVSTEGKRFDLLAMDSAHHRLLAAHSQAGTLSIVDTAAGKLEKEIAVGDKPSGVAVDAQDGKYFVGTLAGVTFVDSKTLDKAGFVATSGPTDDMSFDPASHKLYVTHDDGTELWVIDTRKAAIVGKIDVPGVPEIMQMDSGSRRLYLNIKDKDEVAVIDLATGKITATWPTPATDSPHGAALDFHGGRLYVAGHSAKVSAFSVPDGKALAPIDIGDGRVDQIAFDAGDHHLYIPSSGRLVVVDTAGQKVLGDVPIPQGTHSVAVDPDTHRVWIAYADDKASYVRAFAPAP